MIETFMSHPFIAQFFVAFVILFFFFALVIELKLFCLRLAKHGGYWVTIAKFIFYPFALFFLACDVCFNIVYAPMLFKFERANKHGEGWTLTSRMKLHLEVGAFEIAEGIKPDWNFKVSAFICRYLVNPVDHGHCT